MADANLTEKQHGYGSEVLASTLFWAFIPIALNTMSQPSGRILGLPSWYNFAIRISPVVCAVNAISTLVELLYRTFTFRSIRKAFLGIAARRFMAASSTTHDEGAIQHLRRNSVFRIGLFFLGALPQAIKLYVSNGILWAQVCCTTYLASFVLDEAILYFSSHPGQAGLDAYDEPLQYDHLLGRMKDTVHDVVRFLYSEQQFICFSGMLLDYHLLSERYLQDETYPYPGYPMPTLSGIFLVGMFAGTDPNHTVYCSGIWTCVLIGADITPHLFEGFWPVMLGFWVVSAGLVVPVYFISLIEEKWSVAPGRISRPLATYSVLSHAVTALVYLVLHYESNNTYRPYWTNWLG